MCVNIMHKVCQLAHSLHDCEDAFPNLLSTRSCIYHGSVGLGVGVMGM